MGFLKVISSLSPEDLYNNQMYDQLVGETTYTFAGTPEYLAPEIIKGTGHGRAVDLWSYVISI